MNEGQSQWERFKDFFVWDAAMGFALDISGMNFERDYWIDVKDRMDIAYREMEELEKGSIANVDEHRMVGHYWLRNPDIAPTADIKQQIVDTITAVKQFAKSVRSGEVRSKEGRAFTNMLVIGIGGSALGPQFVTSALAEQNGIKTFFFDNVDPDGMEKTLSTIPSLTNTLTVVISKSGKTRETQNGYLVAKQAYCQKKLNFADHAVAITGEGSELDELAKKDGWMARFPMWDWVGGRTSEMSVVGLLPAAIQGIDIDALLSGARDMDCLTRLRDTRKNPAALLALMWFYAAKIRNNRVMVILPYKDRLELFSRYLQQLIMESIGKEKDRAGKIVEEGIVVLGNKGSTDQHAYVQQLRDGLNNFFVVFIEVLKDKTGLDTYANMDVTGYQVEQKTTCGDYLSGFYQGTRRALLQKGRENITVTIDNIGPRSIGMLIALFERSVGFYALLLNINAYHQPGVEAGKKAAMAVLEQQKQIMSILQKSAQPMNIADIASQLNTCDYETVFKILRRLAANSIVQVQSDTSIFDDIYRIL